MCFCLLQLGENKSLLQAFRSETSLFRVFLNSQTGQFDAMLYGNELSPLDPPGAAILGQTDGRSEPPPEPEPEPEPGAAGDPEREGCPVWTEPQWHVESKAGTAEDIPVPTEDFDDMSSCMAVPDCPINSSLSITTPAGVTYKMNAKMLELQQYLTRIGLAHVFGKMIDQSAFSVDDLTLIDDEKDLIEMGFSLTHERELLLRALAALKSGKGEIRMVCDETAGKEVTRPVQIDTTHPVPIATGGGSGGGADVSVGRGSGTESSDEQQKSSHLSTPKITPLAELKAMRCGGLPHHLLTSFALAQYASGLTACARLFCFVVAA